MADRIEFPAGSWDFDPTNYPEHEKVQITTTQIVITEWFDDTTEEYLVAQTHVPSNIDLAGIVTFESFGSGKAPDGNEVQLCLYHKNSASGSTMAGAYSSKKSGDFNALTTTNLIQRITWSETVAALGWAASDFLRLRLSRCAIDAGSKLVGDFGITDFIINFPTS